MADSRDRSSGQSGGGTVLVSAMAGAVLGAAGLAWWLLSEADRRRQAQRHLRVLRQSGLQGLQSGLQGLQGGQAKPVEDPLHNRVQQLNQAIEDVRRQLEQLQTQP
ncbi:MAG: hypothetical protein WCI65_00455 [Synechococcaceae cyanobacterium ELA263]